MRSIFAAAGVALCLVPSGLQAQERLGSAALGALSGAIVLGPVGAVAGAAIGYTAGPAIANSWGIRPARRGRYARVSSPAVPAGRDVATTQPQSVAPQSAPARSSTQSTPEMNVHARVADADPRVAAPTQSVNVSPSPVVQGLE